MDRTSAQPQVNLSLLRSNLLKFQPQKSSVIFFVNIVCLQNGNLRAFTLLAFFFL